MVPNEATYDAVKICEWEFRRIACKFEKVKYGMVKLFMHMRKQLPSVDEHIIREFIHVRIKIRVKFLNHLKKWKSRSLKNVAKKKQFARSSK